MKAARLALLSAFSAGSIISANAQFVFDNFMEGPDSLTVNTPTGFIEGQESGFLIAGQQRDVLLQALGQAFGQVSTFNVSGSATQGASFLNNGTGSNAFVQLDYDGFDVEGNNGVQTAGPNELNLNLSTSGQFNFAFLASDSPVKIDVTAYTGTTAFSTGTITTSPANFTTPTTFSIAFSSLTPGVGSTGAFNSADLDRLVVRFTPVNAGGDFALSSISASPVPEPASFAAVGIGLIGLTRRRRNRK